MSELLSFDFSKKYQEINHFLETQNKVAYTKEHKFIYGAGKVMDHTKLLQKLQDLSSSLHSGRQALDPEIKRGISSILSNIAQLTEAKLNRIVRSNKPDQVLKERLEDVGRLAVDLGLTLQVPKTRDPSVLLEQSWAVAADEKGSLQRHFTLQRLQDGKMLLSSDVEMPQTAPLRLSSSRSSGVRESQGARNMAPGRVDFSVRDQAGICESFTKQLSSSEKRALIHQLYRVQMGEERAGQPPNFMQQIARLSQVFKIDLQEFGGLDSIATAILARAVYEKCSHEALYTSLRALQSNIRIDPSNLERSLEMRGEISRQEGTISLNVHLKGKLAAEIIDERGAAIKKSELQVEVLLNPMTGQHSEKTAIL